MTSARILSTEVPDHQETITIVLENRDRTVELVLVAEELMGIAYDKGLFNNLK